MIIYLHTALDLPANYMFGKDGQIYLPLGQIMTWEKGMEVCTSKPGFTLPIFKTMEQKNFLVQLIGIISYNKNICIVYRLDLCNKSDSNFITLF